MMNVSSGGVDTCLSVIEAHQKDPGFKSSLESLKEALSSMKGTEAETAAFEKRMKAATDASTAERLRASSALEKLASREEEIARREGEIETAQKSLNDERSAFQVAEDDFNLEAANTRSELSSREADLSHREGELLSKEKALEKAKSEFEAWREDVKRVLAA